MTEIEDVLRTALATAPTPPTTTLDPLADINRRLGRARLRVGVVAVAAVVAVVAAIVVPLSLLGSGGRALPPAKPPTVPVQNWPAKHVESMTAGGGFVWTIGTKQTPRDQHYFIQRRVPSSGAVSKSYRIPDEEQFIAFGLGRVWAWGGGDGGYPDGSMSVLNPSTGTVTSANLGFGKGLDTSPYGYDTGNSLAFAGGRAFGTRENSGGIVAFDPANLGAANAHQPVLKSSGVQSVLGGHRMVLTLGAQGVLDQLPAETTWPPPGPPSYPSIVRGFPLVAAHVGFWAVLHHQLIHEGSAGDQIGPALALPLGATRRYLPAVTGVVIDRSGGLYAAIPALENRVDLLYYSAAALQSAQPRPTAVHRGRAVDRISLDPAGGIVFTAGGLLTGNANIGRWDPVAS